MAWIKKAIIKVELEYEYTEPHSDAWISMDLHNIELPSNYVEDSFEIIKIAKEKV